MIRLRNKIHDNKAAALTKGLGRKSASQVSWSPSGGRTFRKKSTNGGADHAAAPSAPGPAIQPAQAAAGGGQTAPRVRPRGQPASTSSRPEGVGTSIPKHMKVSKPSKGGRIRYRSRTGVRPESGPAKKAAKVSGGGSMMRMVQPSTFWKGPAGMRHDLTGLGIF